jgi:Uma2 family endonuclease
MENELMTIENELQEPAIDYRSMTPQQYIKMERTSEFRHEYYDGYIQAMCGCGSSHSRIGRNLIMTIGKYLEGRSCELFTHELKVGTPSDSAFMYTDAVIVCGEQEYLDDQFDILLNPTAIFEIASPTSHLFDKGRKFHFYQEIPSLKEFIMIDSKKRMIHAYRKRNNGQWKLELFDEKATDLCVQTIRFKISLNEIYRDTGL